MRNSLLQVLFILLLASSVCAADTEDDFTGFWSQENYNAGRVLWYISPKKTDSKIIVTNNGGAGVGLVTVYPFTWELDSNGGKFVMTHHEQPRAYGTKMKPSVPLGKPTASAYTWSSYRGNAKGRIELIKGAPFIRLSDSEARNVLQAISREQAAAQGELPLEENWNSQNKSK